jgi:O-antigen ligase
MENELSADSPQRGITKATIAGAMLGGFLIVGRWSPTRLLAESGSFEVAGQARLYVVALLALLVLSILVDQRSIRVHPRLVSAAVWPFAFGVGLLAFGMGSFAWSPSEDPSKLLDLFLLGIALFAVFAMGVSTQGSCFARGVKFSILVGCGAMAMAGLASTVTGRLSVFGGGSNVFARNMAIMSLIAVDLLVRHGSRRWWLVVPLVGVVLILLSGSRGGLLAACVMAISYMGLARGVRSRFFAMLMVGGAGLVLAMIFTEKGVAAYDRYAERVLYLTIEQSYDSGRFDLLSLAGDIFSDNVILGAGLSSFLCITGWLYPHNIFFEVACEMGLVGLILCLCFIVSVTLSSRKWGFDVLWASLAIGMLVAAQVSGDLFDSRSVFIFGLMAVMARSDHPNR